MADPFLRWAGGKRWVAPTLQRWLEGFPYATYIEPFVGGGAVFFALEPARAIISDLNGELIDAYRVVKSRPSALKRALGLLAVSERAYYQVRAQSPSTRFERAVRFIYLNRTCFGGLHRVNRAGQFNVPYGGGSRSAAVLTESEILATAAKVLKRATLEVCDFEQSLRLASCGDLVICDPTYVRRLRTGVFDRYNDRIFSWEDQVRLAKACQKACLKGVSVIVCNIYCKEVRTLYPFGMCLRVPRHSSIKAKESPRAKLDEALIIAGDRLINHVSRIEGGLRNVA